jgi:hypothetical protein
MNKQITLIQAVLSIAAAATLVAFGSSAQAAPAASEGIIKLPRVVVIGKAPAAAAVQVAQMQYLPRVVVVGPSLKTRMEQQTLAAASVGKTTARAL